MKPCKHCGFEASRQSDDDCPAKPKSWKSLINKGKVGWIIVIAAILHEATHVLPFLAFWLGWTIKGDCH